MVKKSGFVKVERVAPRRQDFAELMKAVPTALFVTMVSKTGLPVEDARNLCAAFKELKD